MHITEKKSAPLCSTKLGYMPNNYGINSSTLQRGARRPMRHGTMRLNFHAKLLPPETRRGIRHRMDLISAGDAYVNVMFGLVWIANLA